MSEINAIISVIIPTYNREYLVSQAIQSVLTQTYRDFELIVVDDASDDNTEAVVNNFNDSRIRYIKHEKNAGVSAARNTGIIAARGEYIAFLDSDDKWLPEKLEKQLRLFKQSPPEVGVIYTWWRVINNRTQVESIRSPKYRGFLLQNLLYNNLVGTPSTVIAKREAFDKGVTFDINLRCCEDWDVWLQLAQHYDFDFVSEPLVEYRDHNEDRRGSVNSNLILEGYLKFLKKHHQKNVDFFKKNGTFSQRIKANFLLNIGRRLICHSHLVCNCEAFKLGQKYIGFSTKLDPLKIYLVGHYLVSLLGNTFYFKAHKTEIKIRKLVAKYSSIS